MRCCTLWWWLVGALAAGCGAAPAPGGEAPAAPAEAAPAVRPEAALWAREIAARQAAGGLTGLDPEALLPGGATVPPRLGAQDIEAIGRLCGEAQAEGLDPQALGCPGFQEARFLARTGFGPGAVADRVALAVRGLEVLLAYGDAAAPKGPALRAQIIAGFGAQPVEALLALVRPAGDQYPRLLAAARRYQARVAAGGFSAVPVGRLARGQRGPGIAALRIRLAEEGFASAPPEGEADHFEQSLWMALGHFQRAHQLTPTPALGPGTHRALRRSAADKLTAVRRALAEWRAAPARGPAGLWIQVNLLDFHGEVWRDSQRIHRFRVVVGDERPDATGAARNATPRLASAIHEVVYNPDWRVPQRILEEEILPRALDAAGFAGLDARLANLGFEVLHRGSPAEHVRQRPGRGNPLGQVKFRFPNPYAVYLHDTPRRDLFAKPRRAFSHGCVRVERALHLARILLEHDGQYDPKAIAGWLQGDEPHAVRLTRPVPIFLDRIGVRVDAEGRAHFLE